MGALGPSGLVGQGLENQAGTRAGQNGKRTGGWDEGSRPGPAHSRKARQEEPTFWDTGQPAALAFRKLARKPPGKKE